MINIWKPQRQRRGFKADGQVHTCCNRNWHNGVRLKQSRHGYRNGKLRFSSVLVFYSSCSIIVTVELLLQGKGWCCPGVFVIGEGHGSPKVWNLWGNSALANILEPPEKKNLVLKKYIIIFFFLFSQFFFFNLLIMKHESFLGSLFGKVPFPLLKSSRKTETLSLSITIWFTFQSDCPDILILIISCRHFSVQMTHFCYFWTFLSFLLYVYHRTPSPPWTRCSPMLPPWRS